MILVVVVKNAKKSESLISSDFDSGLINKCQLWTGKIRHFKQASGIQRVRVCCPLKSFCQCWPRWLIIQLHVPSDIIIFMNLSLRS